MQVLDDVKPLSSKLEVEPLKEGEVAVFRLKRAFLKDGLHEEPTCPEVAQYPGVELIVDPFEKGPNKSKKIGSRILDYKQVQNQLKPVYQPLIFIKGDLRIGADNPGLYTLAMRSKHCASNRFRKQMGGKGLPLWYLVGQDQIVTQAMAEELRFQVEKMLRGCKFDELKAIAFKLNQSPDNRLHIRSYNPGVSEDPQSIKLELINRAKQYPKQVAYASDDVEAKKRVQIYDALSLGILWNEPNKGYRFFDEKDETIDLIQPEAGSDPVESLIKFFEGEKGAASYVKFAAALKKALKVTA